MEGEAAHSKHKVQLKKRIGTGAFGIIYKGTFDGDVVAVKTISSSAGGRGTSAEVRMFFKEASMLRQCQHSRIIGFKALVRLPPESSKGSINSWALVMEYAKSGNVAQRVLDQMMSPGRKLYTTPQALGWALDLARALEYLHMRSPAVLHRDVKASNVMLTEEEGATVAKLSDFGLHVAADDTVDRLLRSLNAVTTSAAAASVRSRSLDCVAAAAADRATVSGSGAAGCSSSRPAGAGATAASSTTGSGSSGRKADDSSSDESDSAIRSSAGGGGSGSAVLPQARIDKDSASGWIARSTQQQKQHKAPSPGIRASADHDYSEMHNATGGRLVYVHNAPADANAVASAQAADALAAVRASDAPKRASSFRRAKHHPPGEAAPRVLSEAQLCASDANASLYAQLAADAASRDASVTTSWDGGSLATDGTWASGSMDDSINGSTAHEELETVFNMTGCTGSLLYMAPEVFQSHAYNEKGDVFGFACILYELLARTLIMFSELPTVTSSEAQDVTEHYAKKVAGGYRPAQPKAVPDDLWRLVSACWHQDPLMRPHMSEVVAVLEDALKNEATAQRQQQAFGLASRMRSLTGSSNTNGASQAHGGAPAVPAVQQEAGPPQSQGCCVIS